MRRTHLLFRGPNRTRAAKQHAAQIGWRDPTTLPAAEHIYQVAFGRPSDVNRSTPPFRAPHYTSAAATLRGTLSLWRWRPGECSLAHGGVLYIGELPEFSFDALEVVREALQRDELIVSSPGNILRVPATFTLIATAASCPCGFLRINDRLCNCPTEAAKRYDALIPSWLRELVVERVC